MATRTVITFSLIALAAIGLVSMLFNAPGALARQLVIAAVTVAVIVLIYRLVMRKRLGGNGEDRAFAKAARQSKKRLKSRKKTTHPSTPATKKKPLRRKSSANLRVIEGKKGKKNNRASS
ncbi:SA1362 family protein [Bacillus sp. FJAT-52991]|uniref:SA1362 family protein n=1 Tax=Bacillus kandeliae TaxID=3129297 RepID=A0ABZ2N2Q9_9BACI